MCCGDDNWKGMLNLVLWFWGGIEEAGMLWGFFCFKQESVQNQVYNLYSFFGEENQRAITGLKVFRSSWEQSWQEKKQRGIFIVRISKFWLESQLLFIPIQTFINSNRCNTTPKWVTFHVIKHGPYVIVDVGSKYIVFHVLIVRIKIKKTSRNVSLGGLWFVKLGESLPMDV